MPFLANNRPWRPEIKKAYVLQPLRWAMSSRDAHLSHRRLRSLSLALAVKRNTTNLPMISSSKMVSFRKPLRGKREKGAHLRPNPRREDG